jgi:putative drug exporter of the RND superfamily
MTIRPGTKSAGPPRAAMATGRLARVLRRLRWPVAVLWIAGITVLAPLASGLAAVTNDTATANLPSAAQSAQVAELQQEAQRASGHPAAQQAIAVFARPGGLRTGDLAAVTAARAAVGALAGRVRGLGSPGAVQRSADGAAALFTVPVSAPQDSVTSVDTRAVTAIRQVVAAEASRPRDGLHAAVTGDAAVTADSGSATLNALLLSTLVIVAVILLLVYRSPVLWLLPLVTAASAVELARAAAHGLAAAGFTVSYLSSAIVIVLVFGAASDYALLLVHRYREELRHHAACEQALAAALRRTLPVLAASAATVTAAMLCLLAAQSGSLHGLGPIGAVAIVSALLAETTFLPALLLILGRAAFWPRVPAPGGPRAPGAETSRVWAAIGARAARHPAAVTLSTVVVLSLACAGLASLRFSSDPLSDLKGHPGSITGEQLLARHFPAGAIAPLVLLAPRSEARAAAHVARGAADVATVTPDPPAAGFAADSVDLSVAPYSAKGFRAIAALRQDLARGAPGALVGGTPAAEYDITQAADRDTAVIIPLALLVILLVIAALLQAIAAPLVLVLTTALSFGASLGLASLLWRYGFRYPGVNPQLPLYIFIFLAALGADYNIFLAARVREESRLAGTRQGTLRGLTVTGGVITAAGVILAATFGALAQLPSVSVTEVGTAITIGVLLDTLLVRTVLVPAALITIGDRAWWPGRRPAATESADSSATAAVVSGS